MIAATSITVRVPLAIHRRGGRKLVITPEGSVPGAVPARVRADPALVKALARAHRWKRLTWDVTLSTAQSARTNSHSAGAQGSRTSIPHTAEGDSSEWDHSEEGGVESHAA